MTLDEAIKIADSKPKNQNLHWYVSEWNDGFIIHSSTYMKMHPEVDYIYSTTEDDRIKKM